MAIHFTERRQLRKPGRKKITGEVSENAVKLDDLIPAGSADAVFEEVLLILNMVSPDTDTRPLFSAFNKTVALYQGRYTGYRACNTGYHDLRHCTATFLAMARIIHGATMEGERFTPRQIVLSLIAALLHDVGYIQEKGDRQGTGAKYTTDHIQRSMDFLENHGTEFGLSHEEIEIGKVMILCTDHNLDIGSIHFPSSRIELLGKMLATVDLLAQAADRIYLEKLRFLYQEFREAKVGDYRSVEEMLQKTGPFFDFIDRRLKVELGSTDRFMYSHFVSRWNISSNLYRNAIEKQKNYLKRILSMAPTDPGKYLRRDGIMDTVREGHGTKPVEWVDAPHGSERKKKIPEEAFSGRAS